MKETDKLRVDFKQIVETNPDAILVINLEGKLFYANKILKKLLKLSEETLKNANIKDILTAESYRIAQKKIREKIKDKKPSKPYLLTAYDSTGREKIVEVYSTPLIFDGETRAIQVTARDVSAEHEAKEKLKSLSEHLGTVLDGIDESIVVIGEDYNIISHNQAFRRHVKGTRKNYVDRKCFEAIHGYEKPCEKCIVRDMFKTGSVQE
ncbi:MAG: PAS domain S-box protein, partial [Candidatus Altiarchaeales archaeon]|nr:PAS domain S-box protein [Candidatus Altiarchaeales archaeon]